MVQVFKSGQTMLNTKVNGEKTKPMAEESSGMLTVMYMRVNGKTTKQMATVSTYTSMVHSMRATGKMIFKMAKAWRAGKTEVVTKAATRKA